MVVAIEESQRNAIATKLADMKAMQNLLISNEEKLKNATSGDKDISDRFQDMLEDDRESVGTIDKTITRFGVSGDPSQKIQDYLGKIEQTMAGEELTLYEKVLEHEVLKHKLVMSGLTVYKASQTLGGELKDTIDPINKVNFKNRAHQEQLKSVIQVLGTRELVGREPDQSIWAQAEDAIAGLRGAFGGLTES